MQKIINFIKKNQKIIFIVLVGLGLRLLWIWLFPQSELTSDPAAYDRIAKDLIAGKGYRTGGQMFAYRPPVYPIFLAVIYSLVGINYMVVGIAQAIISVLTGIIIFQLSKFFLNDKASFIVLILYIFYPQFIRYPSELWSETLFIFLFLLSCLYLCKYSFQDRMIDGVVSGSLMGITSLTREIALFFLIPVLVWIYLNRKENESNKKLASKCLIVSLSIILTMLPWISRNYLIFHKLVPVSTNGGINFYIGNNPDANGEFLWRLPNNLTWPNQLEKLSTQEISVKEYEIYKAGYEEGIEFIKKNPLRSAKLSLKKLFLLWRPPYYDLGLTDFNSESAFRIIWLIYYSTILALGIFGFFISLKEDWKKWLLFYSVIGLVSLVQMLTYADIRYRLPAVPFLMMFSALVIQRYGFRKGCFLKSETA